jgi:hypothetical protein
MTEPGSQLRDLLYAEADTMELPPMLPESVRKKVGRYRRFDALLAGIALVLVIAGVSTVIGNAEDTSLPPAERHPGTVEAGFEVPLEAGVTYRSPALGGVTFAVDPSFAGTHIHLQSRRLLGIHTSSHDGIAVREVRRVFDPETGEKVSAPNDLVAWLLAHPKITARRAGTLEVGGVQASIVVVTDAQVPRVGTPCTEGLLETAPCLPLFHHLGLGGYVRADDLVRIYVWERGDVTYSAEAYGTKRRPELAQRWDALMRSLEFED